MPGRQDEDPGVCQVAVGVEREAGTRNGVFDACDIAAGRILSLDGYARLKREVNLELPGLPRGRLDIGLYDGPKSDALVEVKNVTLLEDGCLRFPDAVSERGRKHLDLLLAAYRRGWRAVILFALNRPEGDWFEPAEDIDPAYAQRLREAAAGGVEVVAVRLQHDVAGLNVGGTVAVRLGG